jgi:UDP-N-acetylglucosamine transferase subunit ALG13
MIFVTVGTQGPFDRMVKIVDEWARRQGRSDVFAQIGATNWRPQHIRYVDSLSPEEFTRKCQMARAIVSHAGMGTIISALELGKPILVVPRRADLGEQRTDHQLATARRFLQLGRVAAAFEEHDLMAKLDELGKLASGQRIESRASPELLSAMRCFINQAGPGRRHGADRLRRRARAW